MDLQLNNKVALITGGSMGIGFAIAEALAKEGVHLLITARNAERLKLAVEKLSTYAVNIKSFVADITQTHDIVSLAKFAEQSFGGVDILINNAGTGTNEKIAEASDEKWYYYWDLHVMAAIRLSRALLPSMKQRGGGVILNNASICAKQPIGYEPIYNTTKAALVMMSKCLAEEVIKDNIRVNAINPGLIRTEAWENAAVEEGKKQGISAEDFLQNIAKENAPIGRFASPEELAHFFVFLCSPLASYCVGSSYYVDGGWLKVTT
ncbi:SDR family NAD(P)-dependent oxidoreductase [Catalinimonas niigatensis]|uniref:SDR family NAD(P)-dependent oxidoreductase n=1 Tax=Catalinimonas niigatensis TaxID=1397264 RepID=UPI0026657DAD|nr:SDR family oxidoreductase [Catalinimonas niigatensis]WPP50313.1 SDR family oxidoreductase [Catalinimonas niigatensis]